MLNWRGDFIVWVWISTLEHTAQEKERDRLQNEPEFISEGIRKAWMNTKPRGRTRSGDQSWVYRVQFRI